MSEPVVYTTHVSQERTFEINIPKTGARYIIKVVMKLNHSDWVYKGYLVNGGNKEVLDGTSPYSSKLTWKSINLTMEKWAEGLADWDDDKRGNWDEAIEEHKDD